MSTLTQQLIDQGIRNPRVITAIANTPRHRFIPPDQKPFAGEDRPLPIGFEQTISQPYIVAFMTECLAPLPHHRILEIGTGCGYQTAILASLAAEVYTIEIIEPLAQSARSILSHLGHTNIHFRTGDGHDGWPQAAPFDSIIATCAPEEIPPALIAQLREGGLLVIPSGPLDNQKLHAIEKHESRTTDRDILNVRFVPMTSPPGSPGED